MDYKEYEKEVKKIIKKNEIYLNEFEKWLNDKKLVSKTIKKHLENVCGQHLHQLNLMRQV